MKQLLFFAVFLTAICGYAAAYAQTSYNEDAPITGLPSGISFQTGPGSNNNLGWMYPYGTKLVVNGGAARNFEFLVTDKSSALSSLMFRQFYQNTSSWGTWRKILVASQNGNIGIGTTDPDTKLAVNGSMSIFCELDNTMPRPAVVSGTIPGEIRGVSGNGWSEGDDGFLRLSAGGGTNAGTKSFIDLSGYTENVPERYMNIVMGTGGTEHLRITFDGKIGIGTATPREKLSVNGHIRAREIKVEASPWPDYIFEEDYPLMTLSDLEQYISKNKHLPNIPSASEVSKDGISLGKMNARLLQKIEELTLYLIEQDKRIEMLEKNSLSHAAHCAGRRNEPEDK